MEIKKIYHTISILFLTTLISSAATGAVTLAWDPNCATNVVSYKVYYGATSSPTSTNIVARYTNDCSIIVPAATNIYSGGFTNFVSVIGRTSTNATITNLVAGTTYHFVATSISFDGLESDYSPEIFTTIPRPKPNPPTGVVATSVK